MPTNPHALLALAHHLQQIRTETADEAILRAALSRFYYATLHHVGQTFKPPQTTPNTPPRSKDGSYEAIMNRVVAYGQAEHQPARIQANCIAKMLPPIKRMQVLAEYDLAQTVTAVMVNDASTRCEQIFQWCNEITKTTSAAASSITDNVDVNST